MAQEPSRHVVFSGGGTGGHLFPGLAVAASLVKSDPATQITFAGSGRELERRLVDQAGYRYLALDCRPFRLRPDRLVSFILAHRRGLAQARAWLAAERPDVVVGLGGFASVPLAHAAAKARVPLVLLEQNAVAGRANRWLAPHASLVCLAFDEARAGLPRTARRVLLTGNPIRAGFDRHERRNRNSAGARLLIVLGGSGGSRQLNAAVPQILGLAGQTLAGWRIVHQTGPADAETVGERYLALGIDADTTSFVDDMPDLLSRANLVISRAGGTTLAELAAAGVPAIVCPWAAAAHDHQRRNAKVFERQGACRIWQPERLDVAEEQRILAQSLAELVIDGNQRAGMSHAMQSLAHPLAADRVAEQIRAMCTASADIALDVSLGESQQSAHLTEPLRVA
jgi:UDP-N-acetylglucosamine--N-acetylmuramyl-(pentapeptide) pyrophosphoryl-undecaprenol N-acetylglucosamine transferase